jgi:site-specific DNA-methyltransferase (adenine-specific)
MRKERTTLKTAALLPNTGQLEWLPKNPRQWTKEDVARTVVSIEEDTDFLEDRPLLVMPKGGSKWVVFAGNLRHAAAKEMGLTEVPCVVYYPETEEDELTIKRRAMKDNGSFGSWDYDELANAWDDLPLEDWGVNVEGLTADTDDQPEAYEDDFNEAEDEIHVRCKLGDVWQLGDHRLMCGDSTDLETVKKLMGGGRS